MTLDYDKIIEVMINAANDFTEKYESNCSLEMMKAAFSAMQDCMPENKGVEGLYSQSADAVVLWTELKNLGR